MLILLRPIFLPECLTAKGDKIDISAGHAINVSYILDPRYIGGCVYGCGCGCGWKRRGF